MKNLKYLFADNFRGFKNTLLPIKNVNFFVGENSTGKTSLLSLLKLLQSPEFWLEQTFNTETVELGNFKDLVSIGSPDKSYFRIGLIEKVLVKEKKKDIDYRAFLMTFSESEGIPRLYKYTFNHKGKQITVIFGGKGTKTITIRYKYENLPKVVNDSEFIDKIFQTWVTSHKKDETGYHEEKIPLSFMKAGILLFLPALMDMFIEGDTQDKTEFEFPEPPIPIIWLAPVRTIPERTYDKYSFKFSSAGMHIPYVIKKILSGKTKAEKEQARLFKRFIEEFGKESGLFQSIDVKEYDRHTKVSPFELDIILNGHALSIDNVGYGVSQVLPVVVELFSRKHGTWFAIQQPEIHIHPKAQASLGNVIFNLALLENKKFLIETHSDFTINRFRMNYRTTEIKSKPDAQIVFFERAQGENKLHCIEISKDGELSDTQPKAYRDFFFKEQMNLLGY